MPALSRALDQSAAACRVQGLAKPTINPWDRRQAIAAFNCAQEWQLQWQAR